MMESKLSGSSLMEKWAIKKEPGLSSNLLTTSLTTSSLKTKTSVFGEDRKRKPDPLKKKSIAKKPSVEKSYLQSSLLSSTSLQNSLLNKPLQSSLLSSNLGGLRPTSSTLSSHSNLQSNLLTKYEGLSNVGARSSALRSHSTGLSSFSSGLTTSLTSKQTVSGTLQSTLPENKSLLKSSITSHAKPTENDSSSSIKRPTNKQKPKQEKGSKRAATDENVFAIKKYTIKAPRYDSLKNAVPGRELAGIVIPDFVSPCKDPSLAKLRAPLHDVNGLKLALVNAVSGSLICQPNFKDATDLTRKTLSVMAESVIQYDPEFILKIALFTRKQLNVRTTANFLLALSANMQPCRPFLKKYYCASITLPSDWIEVAEIYQAFHDRAINQGSLPAALRKVMITKFPDFDKYQLAKYNKESSMKKKKKKAGGESSVGRGRGGYGGLRRGGFRGARGAQGARGGRGGRDGTVQRSLLQSDTDDSDSSDEESGVKRQVSSVEYGEDTESEEKLMEMRFSLKQLIRKLHITEPVEHVMCLIGKRYPETLEDFYKNRLPGTWEEERAGKRMKLPVPETWETQVSLKGNKASTWEELIDHKKLPFMAMLRNLRNLIRAGISQKHHNMIIRRLTDERQVANSKQFPFRFFSAYEVMGKLEEEYKNSQERLVTEAEKEAFGSVVGTVSTQQRGRGRRKGRGRGAKKAENWWIEKREKQKAEKNKAKETEFDMALIARYRKALDTAVKIATVYNVQPIKGHTIVLCDIGPNMNVKCTAAKGLGKPRNMLEVALLMGLMCKYSCERCDLVTFVDNTYDTLEIEQGTILDNLENILRNLQCRDFQTTDSDSSDMQCVLPESILNEALRDRIEIDNIVILSGGDSIHKQNNFMSQYLKKYRQLVNPNLLYVNISFAGKNCGFSESIKPEHENDIFISGFSDAILRFIAERGEGGQLMHVEKIDEAFNLKPLALAGLEKISRPKIQPESPLTLISNIPRWRKTRVFISSTFRDMHGERDVLTRFVFPELRALGKKHFINIHEVDLRWGVTEEVSRTNKTLELCLSEIQKCQFFVGILGERYGYCPNTYNVPDIQEYQWLKTYPEGASVTELEMHLGALCEPSKTRTRAFFYIRDSAFENSIPKEFKSDFLAPDDAQKLNSLKTRIRHSGLEVYDGYPCKWGGIVDGKPLVGGLENFAERVLNNLWRAIQREYPDEHALLDESTNTQQLHQALVEKHKANFVGRKAQIKECIKHIQEISSGIIMVSGKPGTGKSAFMSAVVHAYLNSSVCDGPYTVMVHMVGAAPASTNILATLRRLCFELRRQFDIETEIPEDMKNICPKFAELLKEAGSLSCSPFVLVIDGIDMMESVHQPHNMEWLPNPVPKNVILVISAVEGRKAYEALKRCKPTEITVGGLDMFDKADVVRNNLAVYGKALDESSFNNQLKLLLSKREAVNPLFLKLACEELRVFGVFEQVNVKLKSMPQTTHLLLQDVLARLESDLGQQTVATAMSLLVCVRDGLEREELHEVLSIKEILQSEKMTCADVYNVKLTPEKMLPAAVFSYLQRSLQAFLNPTDSGSEYRMTLAHADITAAVKQRYMKGTEHEQGFHKLLAGYFYQKADPDHDDTFNSANSRAFSQLAYHLSLGVEFSILAKVLCNLRYIYSKCKLGLGVQLLEDYQMREFASKVTAREQEKMLSGCIEHFKMFVSRQLHIINKHPALVWQQAMNEPKDSEVQMAASNINGSLTESNSYMEWESKPSMVDPNYMTLSNLPQPVTCVAISPNNEYFACGGLDCLVRLYHLDTGKELRTFRGHADVITGVCFAGRSSLCSASLDNSISVWHVEDGHRIHLLKKHGRRVKSCASDAVGKHVASASWDCTVIVWSIAKGESVCDFKVGSPVNSVSFHPEGQLIVTGSWDATIKIWDIFHKKRKAVLRGHKSSVRDVAFSPSGRHIASASLDGEVKIWAADNGTQVGNISGHSLPINKLIFTPTGKELVTVSDDHKVKVWSGHLGKPVNCLGSEQDGPAKSVALSPDGKMMAVGYHEGFIKLFSTSTGIELDHLDADHASITCLTFTPDGSFFVFGSASGKCVAYSVQQTPNGRNKTEYGNSEKGIVCVTTTRNYIAVGLEDCSAQLFTVKKNVDYTKTLTLVQKVPDACFRGQVGPITSVTFSPDASKLATASRDASVYIWDVYSNMINKDAEPIQKLLACHCDWITDCKWSNTGEYMVTSSTDFNLKVWDLKTGSEKKRLTGHMGSINHIAYSFGCIVSTCSDGSVKVWSHKGTEITTLYGHSQCVNDCDLYVRVSKDTVVEKEPDLTDWSTEPDPGEEKEKTAKESKRRPEIKMDDVLVATCSDDGTVRLWRPLQANELANLTGHSDRVISIAADGQGNLCTSSLDKSVKLWKPQLSLDNSSYNLDNEITFVVTSQSSVVTGCRGGTIKVWRVIDPMDTVEIKAHEKSVNTACFLSDVKSVVAFVTGSDDGKIIRWKVTEKNGKFSEIIKMDIYVTDSPVTHLLRKPTAVFPNAFLSCEWNGNITMWNALSDMKACSISGVDKYYPKHKSDWMLKLFSFSESSPFAIVTSSNKYIAQLDLRKMIKSEKMTMSVTGATVIESLQDEQDKIPLYKQENNMILDVACFGRFYLCVDSAGQIAACGPEQLKIQFRMKIHAAAVTCIQVYENLMFTGSKDHTIKVWELIENKNENVINSDSLKQIGQFFSPAPVTCLQILQTSSDCIKLVCGDQLGNIHFLSWNSAR